MVNSVCIAGNLTRDSELRSTASGLPVLGFCVAVDERRENRETGRWEDYPNYIDCTMFGERAEKLSRYLRKGAKVTVQGTLRQSRWKDKKDGSNRSKIDVIAKEIEFSSRDRDVEKTRGREPDEPEDFVIPF